MTTEESPWDNFSSIVADSIGIDHSAVDQNRTFTQLGGTSLNMVSTVLQLQKAGLPITVDDFANADNLKGLFANATASVPGENTVDKKKFTVVPIAEVDKVKAQTLEAESFLQKSEAFVGLSDMTVAEFVDVCDKKWEMLLPFSIAVVDASKTIRAVALAADDVDLQAPSNVKLHSHLAHVWEMMCEMSAPARKTLNPNNERGVILYMFLVGGSVKNTPEESVLAFTLLEQGVMRKGNENGFRYTMADNLSPVTQTLSEYLGCKRYAFRYVKDWKSPTTGELPFAKCSATFAAAVDVMDLQEHWRF